MLKWFWPAAMALKVEHLEMLKKKSTFSYNWVQYVYTRHQNKASVHANTKYDKIDYMRTTLYGFLIEWRIAILTKTVQLSFRSYSCRGNYDSPFNRPLPSSKNPHFQNEAKCTIFLVKMSFICTRMKNHCRIKSWALNLVLIQRPRGTSEMAYCQSLGRGQCQPQQWINLPLK